MTAAIRLQNRKSFGSPFQHSKKPPRRFTPSTSAIGGMRNTARSGCKLPSICVSGNRSLRVDRIGTPEILKVLAPIWLTKGETARRVKQRIGTVSSTGREQQVDRDGENPITGVSKGLPKQTDRAKHHAALPYKDVPAFFQRLRLSAR